MQKIELEAQAQAAPVSQLSRQCPGFLPWCLLSAESLNPEEYANHPLGTTFPTKVDDFWKSSKQPLTPLLSFWQNMLLNLKTNAVIFWD